MRAPGAATGVTALEMRHGRVRLCGRHRSAGAAHDEFFVEGRETRTRSIRPRRSTPATARAPRRSAGSGARRRRARCATARIWSAGAWRPASGMRYGREVRGQRHADRRTAGSSIALRRLGHRHRHLDHPGAGRSRCVRAAARAGHRPHRRFQPCRRRRSRAGPGRRPRPGLRSRPRAKPSSGRCSSTPRRCRIHRSATPGSRMSTIADGRIALTADPARGLTIAEVMHAAELPKIEEKGVAAPDMRQMMKYISYTHSAVFAEVHVDEELGVVRVTRIVCAVAAGRIINPKTARSQILGGVVMGLGMALHEEAMTDHRLGRIMNHNFADYHVPAHADVRGHRGHFRRRARRQGQPARREGPGRDRHRRHGGRGRQCRSSMRPASGSAICRSRSTSCCNN